MTMTLNDNNTEYLTTDVNEHGSIKISGTQLSRVTSFKYLGSAVTSDGKLEVNARITDTSFVLNVLDPADRVLDTCLFNTVAMSVPPRCATGNCSPLRAKLITDIRVQATGPSDRPAYGDPCHITWLMTLKTGETPQQPPTQSPAISALVKMNNKMDRLNARINVVENQSKNAQLKSDKFPIPIKIRTPVIADLSEPAEEEERRRSLEALEKEALELEKKAEESVKQLEAIEDELEKWKEIIREEREKGQALKRYHDQIKKRWGRLQMLKYALCFAFEPYNGKV
ncbi:unnamed protein product [Heligmosomoides polygyrus]|uniref:Major sperm protein n=1 Tax=Heligmosomoides polygyrus TaxID=6339 RepID=A0A3P7X4R0_HELPZ|nr:unnamed protein product [Heligmosomoides polygyrus]